VAPRYGCLRPGLVQVWPLAREYRTPLLASGAWNCSDPSGLAKFWSGLLGGEPSRINDNFYVVRSGSIWLAAQHIDSFQPPTWPDGDRPKADASRHSR
jgi:hypothetical protein